MDSVPDDPNGSLRWRLVVGALVILAALIAALVLVTGGDRDDSDSAASTDVATTQGSAITTPDPTVAPDTEPSTTDVPTTEAPTTDAPTTEAPSTDPADATRDAVWPWVDTSTRFADPVEAATSFAIDYLGFTDPVVGGFQAGDSRSGEVEITAGGTALTTVVFVRQLTDDDSWWVLGAASENITIDEPTQGTVVSSPLAISGKASAFEGTVDVELRADGNGEPIYVGFVTGSGSPEPGPYEATIEFTSPGPAGGALVLISRSSEDGSVLEASALRIFFG
ncbi:MAG TPA: Gmad2 immunoglobulin-like domain-containing protein [Ilumatobacteraceae bacterium]|nr:Gmad2 immunoglobulin-like domain-containing protein [Ilumatobacteraceae bacterium]